MAEFDVDSVFLLKDGKFFAKGTIIDMHFKGNSIHYILEELRHPETNDFFSGGIVFLKHIHIVSIATFIKEYPFILDFGCDVVSCYCGQLNGTDIDSMDDVTIAHISW